MRGSASGEEIEESPVTVADMEKSRRVRTAGRAF
jgi:hypothetical protein